jgi:oligopeptide transport system substrate-binding protein
MGRMLTYAVAIGVLLVGCDEVEIPAKRHLKVSSPFEPCSIDTQKISFDDDYKIIQAAFEGLVVPDPETMEPRPGMAERWEISPDGMVYDFILRDNATWSNGKPVTAKDFEFTVKRALSSQFACANVEMFFSVRNAKEFFYKRIRDFSKVGIKAINSRTLRIELEKNTPYFLTILMHPCWLPLNDDVIESFKQYNRGMYPTDAFKMKVVSNGPFTFTERIPGTCMLLKRNAAYWDADNVLLDTVTFYFCQNQVSSMKSFLEDEISILEVRSEIDVAMDACYDGERLIISPIPECFGLAFNMANPAFHDRRVRLALSMAIDREKILGKLGKSSTMAAYKFIPQINSKYVSKDLFEHDVELAKKLFKEAGYGERNEFPRVKILCSTMDHSSDVAVMEQIIDDWASILGIKCTIEAKDLDYFIDFRVRSKFDVIKISYGEMYCDPASMIESFVSWETKKYGRWCDTTYDDIVVAIDRASDGPERMRLIRDAQERLAEEMPIIPLFFRSSTYLIKKDVRGWFRNPMNMHPIKFVYFDGH